jgi:biotin carboxylase
VSALVVLGGADGSIGTLRAARDLGLRTICVDVRADAPGGLIADELLNISTHRVDALIGALAPIRDIAGVVSPASDVNLPVQYAVARALGLPVGLSAPSVRASVDKGFFREVCDRLRLSGPRFVQGTPEQVIDAAARLAPRVMVKPTDSSGSRGVQCVADMALLDTALTEAASFSPTGIVIVEEFLTGADFTAEAVVVDGRVGLLGITARTLTPPPHFVTREHRAPAVDVTADEVGPILDALCAALDYRWGALNVDLMRTDDGRLVVGEWGARLGGNGVAELLLLTCGVDATEAYVRMAIGERVGLVPRFARRAGMRVLSAPEPGKLTGIEGLDAARAVPGVADIVLAVAPGEHVVPYTRAGAKLGYILASGENAADVETTFAAVERVLRFVIETES